MTFMYPKGRKTFTYEKKFKYVLGLTEYFFNFFFNLSQFVGRNRLRMAFLFWFKRLLEDKEIFKAEMKRAEGMLLRWNAWHCVPQDN